LRAFLTLLVIAHHAVLTYHPYAPAPKAFAAPPILWTAFPVVDPQKFGGFGLLTLVNDMFFMSLMFLVSGLFVAGEPGGQGRGRVPEGQGAAAGRSVRGRGGAAGAAGLLSRLAAVGRRAIAGRLCRGLDQPAVLAQRPGLVPVGAAGLRRRRRGAGPPVSRLVPALGRWTQGAARRPGRAFLILVAASALAYVPLNMVLPFGHWTLEGPFLIQTGRAATTWSISWPVWRSARRASARD
jgi:hypothetical protein